MAPYGSVRRFVAMSSGEGHRDLRAIRDQLEGSRCSRRGQSLDAATLAFEYVTRYLEGGNDNLAVYRDDSRPTFVAQEFRTMVDQMADSCSHSTGALRSRRT